MPITDLLEENARKFGSDVALVEVNPQVQETRRVLWKDYDLIQPTSSFWYRREITWHVFDEKANRFAQLLMSRGVKKGDKVAILLMNCLEWLPIYFGVLKTGALAVPMNFRYSAEEIEYCIWLRQMYLCSDRSLSEELKQLQSRSAKNASCFMLAETALLLQKIMTSSLRTAPVFHRESR